MPTFNGAGVREDAARCQKDLLVEDGRDQLCRKLSIDALPSDVLLEISKFYLDLSQHNHSPFIVDGTSLDPWHTLVHVCRRWRYTVFASPRYLNLRLHCTNRTPVREMLDIWPAFPIVVMCHDTPHSQLRGVRNVIAALKCPDRVCEINLQGVQENLLKRVAAINVPFLTLTSLRLSSGFGDYECLGQPIITDSILGGIAPRLRSLDLHGIAFPEPQKLLLSATDLVTLRLERIPSIGYISPEELVTCLSTLTKLEELALGFRTFRLPPFHPHQTSQSLLPAPSTVLPTLTSFRFRGDSWYLEDFIPRIAFPLLGNLDVTFIGWRNVDSPPLCEFINRIETLDKHHRADISFHDDFVNIILSRQEGLADCGKIKFGILCSTLDLQLFCLMQLRSFSLPSLLTLEHLYIHGHGSFPLDCRQLSPENVRWLEILHPFTSVKKVYLSEKPALRVARALQGLSGEMVASMLPALQSISFIGHEPSGATLDAIGNFVATLQLSGRSVSVHC